MNELIETANEAVDSLQNLVEDLTEEFSWKFNKDKPANEVLDEHQHGAHALAWVATYVEALRQLAGWAERLEERGLLGNLETEMLGVAFGEYVTQIFGGIPMCQGEFARLEDILSLHDVHEDYMSDALEQYIILRQILGRRTSLLELMLAQRGAASIGATGLDEDIESIRDHIRKFADEKIVPNAQEWHVRDALIPIELVTELAEMGVFGLTVSEDYGGSGMSKIAMCVVSEELSRGYLGVGSLATRSEIAAELVVGGGTEEQKQKWLPEIASGAAIPTAVFTEPGAGSDLGSLRTRAERNNRGYRITGNKTWITHASRANLMTLLARTDPETTDHRGLSMFLVEKQPANDESAFPDHAITGTEIPVIGYRGMKEFEIGLDGLAVGSDSLLGGEEGLGFKQLMQTFESARIQTAARAVGVAQSAFDAALAYAVERSQFGKSIVSFARVESKLIMMAVEIMLCRQLTYYAAARKDSGQRCDLEAGMAKLLAARVAWTAADNCVQIHGGNGFAVESPASRILCDARILSIFEGAAEIQANVIARRLLQQYMK